VLALGICEDNFNAFVNVWPQIIVLRPPVNMIQFCRSGAGISSWDNVSSAYLKIKFPAVTVVRSATLTT